MAKAKVSNADAGPLRYARLRAKPTIGGRLLEAYALSERCATPTVRRRPTDPKDPTVMMSPQARSVRE